MVTGFHRAHGMQNANNNNPGGWARLWEGGR